MARNLGATISELFKSNPALSSDTTFSSTEIPATPQFANASSGYNFIDDQDDLTAWTQSIPASTTLSQVAGIAGPPPDEALRTVTRVQFTNASGASITKALAAALNLPQGDLVRRCIEGSFWFYSLKTELQTRLQIRTQKRVPLDGSATAQVLLPPQRWVRHPVDCFTGSDAGSNIELTITEDQFDGTYGDVDMYVCLVAIKDTTAGEIAISNIATGNPTVITLAADHKLQPHTLTQVLINGVTGNTPDFSNDYGAGQTANTYAQYISPTQLSIPVDTTVAGTGGTVTFPFSNLFATTPRADIGEQANSIRLIKRKGILYGGDSIAASSRAGVASYMALAALGVINAGYTQTGAGVVTTATGGDTIEQQLTKIQARSEIEKRSLIGVVACGADLLTDIPAKLATVASIVSEFTSVGNNDYLVMGFHTGSNSTAQVLADTASINASLLAIYGDKFLNTYQGMVDASNETAKAAGIIGDEYLNDFVHPNDAGIKLFFNLMADKLVALGYNDGLGSIINEPITHTQRPLDVETQLISKFNEPAFTFVYRFSMSVAQAALTQSNGIISIDGNADSLLYIDAAGIKTNHGAQLINPALAANEIITVVVPGGSTSGNIRLGIMQAGVWTWTAPVAYVPPVLDSVITIGKGMQAGNTYDIEIREPYAEEKTQAWIEANY